MGKRSRRRQKSSSSGSGKAVRLTRRHRKEDFRRQLVDIQNPSVPAIVVAHRLLNLYREETRQDENGFNLAKKAPPGRIAGIARCMVEIEPSVAALTFAAGAAEADGNHALCAEMYERAMELSPDEDDFGWLLVTSLVDAGRVADALDLAEQLAAEDPTDFFYFDGLREALTEAHQRRELPPMSNCTCGSGEAFIECCASRESTALSRFHDRSELDDLVESLTHWALQPAMKAHFQAAADRWFVRDVALEEAVEDEPFMQWAFTAPLHEEEDDEGAQNSIIGHYISDPQTDVELRAWADDWEVSGRWGLWQVHVRGMGQPGYLLTDMVSGQDIYASLDDTLGEVHPWSVFLGLMVPIHGIWRPTSTLLRLSPSEGEALGREIFARADELLESVLGERFGFPELETFPLRVEFTGPSPYLLLHMMNILTYVNFPRFIKKLTDAPTRATAHNQVDPEDLFGHPTDWKAWPDEPNPLLGGMTPRQAANDGMLRAEVEALLRRFEYEVSVNGKAGAGGFAVICLREALDM